MNNLKQYILGDKIISTTEDRYNRTFKALGYEPYVEKKSVKEVAKTETEKNEKKSFKKED